jgi:hypothetical protein
MVRSGKLNNGSMRSAERKRHERRLKRAGKVFISFWIDEADLAWKLAAAGAIDPNRADDGKALSEGTRKLVEALEVGVARDITR